MTGIVNYLIERKNNAPNTGANRTSRLEVVAFDGRYCESVAAVAAVNGISEKAAAFGILQTSDAGEDLQRLARKYLHAYKGEHTEDVMISFALEGELRRQLAIPDGDDQGDLHITLGYFGETSELITQEKMQNLCTKLAATLEPMAFDLSGIARFSSDDGDDALVILVNHPELPEIYQRMRSIANVVGVPYNPNFGYTPHITLGWLDRDDAMPLQRFSKVTARISAIELHYGNDIQTYHLGWPEEQTKDVHTGNGGRRKRRKEKPVVLRARSILGGTQ